MTHADAPVSAVIFDIGATLVTGPPVAPNKVIAALIEGVTASEVASVIMTQPFECAGCVCRALSSAFGPLSEPAVRGITDLWESQADAAREIEGATGAVMPLKNRGFKIGLLSDIWSPYYASVEKALPEVVDAADSIVLSCRTGARKPSPDNFKTVLLELGVEPEEAVMVGDTYAHDILPALELGMRAVWVLARPEREQQSVIGVLNGNAVPPTATVSTIGEIASVGLLMCTASAS